MKDDIFVGNLLKNWNMRADRHGEFDIIDEE